MNRRLLAFAALLSLAGSAATASAEPPNDHEPRGDRAVRAGQHEAPPQRTQAAPAQAAPQARTYGQPGANPGWTGARGGAPRADMQPRTDAQARGGWSRANPTPNGAAAAGQAGGGWRDRNGSGGGPAWRGQGFAGQNPGGQGAGGQEQWRQRNAQPGVVPRGDWGRNDGRGVRQADQAQGRRDWQRNQPWTGERNGGGWRRYGEAQRFSYRGRSFFRWRADPFVWPIGFGVRRWRVHEILPPVFLDESYYIQDWTDFGLPPAPYGLQWIRVGDDALLVDAYTGEVVDEVPNVFYW